MRVALSEHRIARLPKPPKGQRLEVRDLSVPGLVLRVTDKGAKTFCVRYRLGQRTLRYTLGKHGALTAKAARLAAIRVLAEAAVGSDPMRQKRRTEGSAPQGVTVSDALNRFIFDWLPARTKEGALKHAYTTEVSRLLLKEVQPKWSRKRLAEVSALDLTNLLGVIAAPSTRRHTYFALRSFFKWAEGVGLLAKNPIPTNFPNPTKPQARDRVLADDELARIWHHTHRGQCAFHAIVALLLLSGQRRDEVADAEWSEFDLSKAVWTIPAHRTKNRRLHHVPLTEPMTRLLLAIPSIGSSFLFPSARNAHRTFSGWSRAKDRLDKQVGVQKWTLHDLRRTLATRLSEQRIQPHVVERLLNHSTGIVSGVSAVYNRATYLLEVRHALEQWSHHVTTLSCDTSKPHLLAFERPCVFSTR